MVRSKVEQAEGQTQKIFEPAFNQGEIMAREENVESPRTERETRRLFYKNSLNKFLDPNLYTFELPPPPENIEDIDKDEYRRELAAKYGDNWLFRPNNRNQFLIFFNSLLEDKRLPLNDAEKGIVLNSIDAVRSLNSTRIVEEVITPDGSKTGVWITKYLPAKRRLVTEADMDVMRKSIQNIIDMLEAMNLNKNKEAA